MPSTDINPLLMDDAEASSLLCLSGLVMPFNSNNEQLSFNFPFDDTVNTNMLSNNQTKDLLDENEGFVEIQTQLSDQSCFNLIDNLAAFPKDHLVNDASNNEQFSLDFSFLVDDTVDTNMLTNNKTDVLLDEIQGLVEIQTQLFDESFIGLNDGLAALPINNCVNDNSNNEQFSLDFSFDDTVKTNMLTNNQAEDLLDEIQGLVEIETEVFGENFFNLNNDSVVLSKDNCVNNNRQSKKKHQNQSYVVKSSDINNTINFTNGSEFIHTGQSLTLTVPPFPYQHVRYEQELEDTLRYIFVPNNDSITLKVSNFADLKHMFKPEVSFWLRITRTTKPYKNNNNSIFYHPYPIWLNDKCAKVHNGCLFIPISDEITKIENLVMQRTKQNVLKEIKEFMIYTTTQLDFNELYSTNTNKAKSIVNDYELRYSILYFQIFAVDQNHMAYPTDLQCQTEPIYEYEANEFKTLPSIVRTVHEHSIKRKRIGQPKHSKVVNKKMSKDINKAKGPYPQG